MDVKKELGLKIKRLRQKEGLTQEQFAEKIGVATSSRVDFSLPNILKWLTAFKIEDETQKRILNGDTFVRTINNLFEKEPSVAYSSIGEYFAYQM